MDSNLQQFARGALEIIGEQELKAKLASGKKLRIKQGIDPTAPDLHLGYLVTHALMRRFQENGHTVVLLWGDFTARIGDPTDKLDAREGKSLSQINANIKKLEPALTKVFEKKGLEIRRNSEWWDKMRLEEFLKIAKLVSATHLWERDMFSQRTKKGKPVWSHEFLYPILQGYDSVMLEADVTVIGSDQKFNELIARDLQKHFGQSRQALIIMPILTGLDGLQKMSQSLGNYVAIDEEPSEMFGKLMSMPDSNIIPYFKLLTDIESGKLERFEHELSERTINPRDLKMKLAHTIVTRLHSLEAADKAQSNFVKIFQEKKGPNQIKTISVNRPEINIIDLLLKTGLASSRTEARRLVEQGGIKAESKVVTAIDESMRIPKEGLTLQRGKRHFVRVLP